MEKHSEHWNDFNQITTQILLTDADLGITLTDVAVTHQDAASKAKSIQRARKAYDDITKRRGSLNMSKADSESLEAKLARLRERLTDLGETFG